jgi:hypothetical protein
VGLLWWQGESPVPGARVDYEVFRKLYRDGALDNRKIQLDIPDGRSRLPLEIGGVSGFGVNELIFRVRHSTSLLVWLNKLLASPTPTVLDDT